MLSKGIVECKHDTNHYTITSPETWKFHVTVMLKGTGSGTRLGEGEW